MKERQTMLTTTQLISCINEDWQLNNIIRAQHNKAVDTITIFGHEDISAFLKVRLGQSTVSTDFLGALPKKLTSDKLRRLFEHIAEYENTPLDDREDKQPIKYNGLFIADLVADYIQPSDWSSCWAMPTPVVTLRFRLVEYECRAHRYSKKERDIFEQEIKHLYAREARVEITG